MFVIFAARQPRSLVLGLLSASLFALLCIGGGNWLIHQVGPSNPAIVSPLAVVGAFGYLLSMLGLLLQRRIGYRLVRT